MQKYRKIYKNMFKLTVLPPQHFIRFSSCLKVIAFKTIITKLGSIKFLVIMHTKCIIVNNLPLT